MDIIESEVKTISQKCHSTIKNSKVVTCMSSLIRVDLQQSHSRRLSVCLRFPVNYPDSKILVELKSKTLSHKLLDGVTNLCEQKAKELIGSPQAMKMLEFVAAYLNDNPLCVAFDEIANLKKMLNTNDGSELKLRQKISTVLLTAKGGKYFFKIKATVPDNYPLSAVSWDEYESNLPIVLIRFVNGQSREIARQCVESPLRQDKSGQPFEPKPSLQKALGFIIDATSDFHIEYCPMCKNICLPDNPDTIVTNDTQDDYIERVFCGHIYHQGCLRKYLQEPPFPPGGKICPAPKRHPRSDNPLAINKRQATGSNKSQANQPTTCSIRLSHDRWGLSVKVAEARWAQRQARERELEEVKDFLQ